MLVAQPGKRDNAGFFSTDLIYDIVDEGKEIGRLVYSKKELRGSLTLGDEAYRIERLTGARDERLYQALIRVMTGGAKPPANPYALKDAGGRALALGEQIRQGFAVGRGDDSFTFRKPSLFSRLYHLYRHGSEDSLGSVGQEKLLGRTLHMRLPAEFDPAFQVFLLALLLNLGMQALENSPS